MIKEKYTFKQFQKRCPEIIDNYFEEKGGKYAEDADLKTLMSWFKLTWPHHSLSIAHPVNEVRGDHAGYGRDCQQKGKLKGLHDVLIFLPGGMYGFMTLELKKRDHTGSVSEDQIQIALKNIENGGYSCIAWGVNPAKEAIKKYMALRGE